MTGTPELTHSLPSPTLLNESTPKREPSARAAYFRRLGALGRIAGMALFAFAVYLSGRLGVEMARNRLPDAAKVGTTAEETGAPLTVGREGDPIYLAQSPESLRSFFVRYPSPEERASADLGGLGIRRLQDSVKMTTLRAEADAIEVKVTSGAIAGAVYWIHYTQLPDPSSFDPIISPVPSGSSR